MNRGPTDYESVALPTELRWPVMRQGVYSKLRSPLQGFSAGYRRTASPGALIHRSRPGSHEPCGRSKRNRVQCPWQDCSKIPEIPTDQRSEQELSASHRLPGSSISALRCAEAFLSVGKWHRIDEAASPHVRMSHNAERSSRSRTTRDVVLEAEERQNRRVEKLLRDARIPRDKMPATLDLDRLTATVRNQVCALCNRQFLPSATNICVFDNPGTGKIHLVDVKHSPKRSAATA